MPNSDIIYLNRGAIATLLEDFPAVIEFDEAGIAAAELNYTVLWDAAPDLVAVLDEHPDYPWLIRKSATITREEAMMAKVNVKFEGIPPGDGGGGGSDPTFTDYSCDGSTSSDPIETHPDFEDFAGTWNAPLNGAVFIPADSTKALSAENFKFKEFAVVTPTPAHPKAGVTSYETPGLVYTETRTYAVADLGNVTLNMSNLGKVDDPPESDYLPTYESPRSWLLVSAKVQRVGRGMKISRSWKLSGPNGWDPDIYDPPA